VYSTVGYSQQTDDEIFMHIVNGTTYINRDSIAIYLYEPLMEYMVLYRIERTGRGWKGVIQYPRKEVEVWIYANRIFVKYKDETHKLTIRQKTIWKDDQD
jgi:hypothetical protein